MYFQIFVIDQPVKRTGIYMAAYNQPDVCGPANHGLYNLPSVCLEQINMDRMGFKLPVGLQD